MAWGRYKAPGHLLDADFLEFYGLDIYNTMANDRLRGYGLIGNLPTGSRLAEEELGGKPLDYSDMVLSMVEYWLHNWIWAHTDDAKSKANRPEVMVPAYIKMAQATVEEKERLATTPASIRDYVYGASFN